MVGPTSCRARGTTYQRLRPESDEEFLWAGSLQRKCVGEKKPGGSL